MKLSRQDADLFFELMWALQYFVNQKYQILPTITTLKDYSSCSAEDKMKVRQRLYEHPEVIDAFIQENPEQFSEAELDIIGKWKQFIADDFYIERMLKKYTIFISSDNTVYGVIALHDAFDEIFFRSQLPTIVKGVLLPFKGRIIYDGLLQSYNVFFGSGFSGDLKEIYLTAKLRGEIVESLEAPKTQEVILKPSKAHPDWAPTLDELVAKARNLRGAKGQPAIYSPAFSLIKASLELGQLAVLDPNDVDQLWKCLKKAEQALRKVENTLYRLGK
jgi:hypothetical protein